MSNTQCVVCTRDSPNAYTCNECITNLAAGLDTLAWLAAELLVTYTRQDRLATTGGRHSTGSPLGYNAAASRAYAALQSMLARRTPHRGTPAAMIRTLIENIDDYRGDPGTDHVVKDIEHHTKIALEIINPLDQDEQTYGVCGEPQSDGTICTAYLYGQAHADWVRCRRCRTQHDSRRRIQALEKRMRVLYFRAATLARLLPRLIERPVSANNIRSWAFNGRPIRTRTDDSGFVTYHTGDVIAVANATPTRNRTSRVTRHDTPVTQLA